MRICAGIFLGCRLLHRNEEYLFLITYFSHVDSSRYLLAARSKDTEVQKQPSVCDGAITFYE